MGDSPKGIPECLIKTFGLFVVGFCPHEVPSEMPGSPTEFPDNIQEEWDKYREEKEEQEYNEYWEGWSGRGNSYGNTYGSCWINNFEKFCDENGYSMVDNGYWIKDLGSRKLITFAPQIWVTQGQKITIYEPKRYEDTYPAANLLVHYFSDRPFASQINGPVSLHSMTPEGFSNTGRILRHGTTNYRHHGKIPVSEITAYMQETLGLYW